MAEHVLGLILKGYPRVSEPFVTNEIRLLEEAGFRLHIYSIRNPKEGMTDDLAAGVAAPVSYLTPQFKGHALSLLGDGLAVAMRHPLRFVRGSAMMARWTWKRRTWAVAKHFLQAAHLVRRHLQNSGVTRLHAHFAHNPANVAMYASILSGIPFSFTAHAKDIWTKDPAQLAEKIKRAELTLTCTECNHRYLNRLNPGRTPVRVAYHGVDLDLCTTPNTRVPAPPYVILSVARMVDKKGLDTVLRALVLLRDRGMEFVFRHVGEGKRAGRIKKLAEELDLGGQVQWLGSMPRREVIREYLAADVFVLGCRVAEDGDRDGIPNVLAEAMALGLPVVSGDVSAIPELVRHEIDGLLVPPDSPQSMAEALVRALTDEEFRKIAQESGPRRIREAFDSRKTIQDVVAAFRESGFSAGNRGRS